MSICISTLGRLAQNDVPEVSHRFMHRMALEKCPCAFRLRRLAQNHVPGCVLGHFPCKCPYKIALLTCPCAFRLRRLAHKRDISYRNRSQILRWDLLQTSCQQRSYRDLVQVEVLYQRPGEESRGLPERSFTDSLNRGLTLRSLTDRLWRSLKGRSLYESCKETSYRNLVQRSCQNTSFGDLVRRHCTKICCRDLAKRSLA